MVIREVVEKMVLSHDGRYTIIITRDHQINFHMHIYDSSDGWTQVFNNEINMPISLSISPNNRVALLGNWDGSVDIYRLPN